MTSDRDERLNEVLLAYLEGGTSAEDVFEQHPEFAGELADFIACRQSVETLAAPLRQAFQDDPESFHTYGFHAGFGDFSPSLTHGAEAAIPSCAKEPEARRLGDFRLLRELGRGGMGIVYEAEQLSLGRRVALKVLPMTVGLDDRQLHRFKNEASAAASLHHPNIVPVYTIGQEDGVHYYAMQLIEGRSLADILTMLRKETGSQQTRERAAGTTAPAADWPGAGWPHPSTFSESRSSHAGARPTMDPCLARGSLFHQSIAELGIKAARALEHAHQEGIIHRDIKPANLLLDSQGELWITDFGLALFQKGAEITRTGEVIGTLRYMSPEQALGRRALIDQRTDIYSLGATLYELLTLEPIFAAQDSYELLQQIAYQDPRAPRVFDRTIPVDLETILLKSTAKSPSDRYTDAGEMAADLQSFLAGAPIQARRPSFLELSGRWARRHKLLVTTALSALFLIAAILAVVNILLVRASSEVREAYLREQQRSQEALQQRERAEQTFRQGQRAMNHFIELSEEELFDRPRFFGLRMKLLETALTYYQDVTRREEGDSAIQLELVDARRRIERLLQERSTLQHFNPLELLSYPEVQKDLDLAPAQKKLAALRWSELSQQDPRRSSDTAEPLSAEERRKQALERSRHCSRMAAEILTPAQLARLEQINWQCLGAQAFCHPTIIEALGLTETQQKALSRIRNEKDLQRPVLALQRPEAVHNRIAQRRALALERSIAQLTPGQLRRWQDITGKPFRSEVLACSCREGNH